MDSSQPLPIKKPTPCSNTIALRNKFKHSRNTSPSMKKHSSGPRKGTHLMKGTSCIFTSHMAMGSPAPLSGSNSMTMVQHLGTQTSMVQVPYPTSSTYMRKLMTSMMTKERQNPHSPSQHGSAFS